MEEGETHQGMQLEGDRNSQKADSSVLSFLWVALAIIGVLLIGVSAYFFYRGIGDSGESAFPASQKSETFPGDSVESIEAGLEQIDIESIGNEIEDIKSEMLQ